MATDKSGRSNVVAVRLKLIFGSFAGQVFPILNRPTQLTSSMPRLLSGEQIKEALQKLNGWSAEGKFIVKAFEFKEFTEGIRFVNLVADVAERLEHHPDISIRYTKVTLALQTHSAGGVTQWDIQLARAIDRLGERTPDGARSSSKVSSNR